VRIDELGLLIIKLTVMTGKVFTVGVEQVKEKQ
jgi:hypothetical protein